MAWWYTYLLLSYNYALTLVLTRDKSHRGILPWYVFLYRYIY